MTDVAAEGGEVEFFGVKLTVRSPHLAALLNTDVTDDVRVVRQRARDAFAGDDVPAGDAVACVAPAADPEAPDDEGAGQA